MTTPFSSPLYVMPKAVGSACNLRCTYCYYLEKKHYYPSSPQIMSEATLEEYIKQYIAAQTVPEVVFTWHGGEPLLRPVKFYERAIELQKQYGRGRNIVNCIQTNGTLLNDDWCRFFRREGWLVGVSIDGPEEFHDEYRRNANGGPTHRNVMRGIRLMQRHGVEWNALAVVNDYNADYPVDFYRFFKDIGCQYIQFTPVVERLKPDRMLADASVADARLTDFSITPEQWGDFLIGVFDEWIKEDVGRIFVQMFDSTLANWAGEIPGVCTLAPQCGHAAAMECNGDVYSCDHFVFPSYKLGNIHSSSLIDMMTSPRQLEFGAAKRTGLPQQCLGCKWLFACNGECPRNRFARTAAGEPGLNCLCEGYRRFFEHSAPYMEFMRNELKAGRAPANVMDWARGR